MDKTAVITGVTGQDGAYLSKLLLNSGYNVIGIKRRTSQNNTGRLINVLDNSRFVLEEGDVADPTYIFSLLNKYKPYALFNLAAQSHVGTSFSQPTLTTNITYIGALNCLEGIRLFSPETRFYQASSSEMFGNSISYYETNGRVNTTVISQEDITEFRCGSYFQDEKTPFKPQSPYAIAKLAAHHLTELYRKSYGIFACSGILFNHESELRGDNFVTKKITNYIAYLRTNPINLQKLKLGNLDAVRDWGHAEDYVVAMKKMVESQKPDTYVVGTGRVFSVKDFLNEAFGLVGLNWEEYVEIDDSLKRPSEVPLLRALPAKIHRDLYWAPEINFNTLVRRMLCIP